MVCRYKIRGCLIFHAPYENTSMIFSSRRFFQKTNELYYYVNLFSFIFWKKLETLNRHFELTSTSNMIFKNVTHKVSSFQKIFESQKR